MFDKSFQFCCLFICIVLTLACVTLLSVLVLSGRFMFFEIKLGNNSQDSGRFLSLLRLFELAQSDIANL